MACYVPEMDLWRERKEGGGDPGQVEAHMIYVGIYLQQCHGDRQGSTFRLTFSHFELAQDHVLPARML